MIPEYKYLLQLTLCDGARSKYLESLDISPALQYPAYMPPSLVHLPNGQSLTVTPVFGGISFKSNELSNHHAPFPPGWTVVIYTEDEEENGTTRPPSDPPSRTGSRPSTPKPLSPKRSPTHRFTKPTLNRDHLFISSMLQPNSADYKPISSPSRQLAMLLWATLWWYFHQPEPDMRILTKFSSYTAPSGQPRGSWRVNINREGIFKNKVELPKLERMGLVTSDESFVGTDFNDRVGEGWERMFVSRQAFWQLDPRIYLFSLASASGSPYIPGTPNISRPASPSRADHRHSVEISSMANSLVVAGPYLSPSHLPTYYPPGPAQFVRSNGVMHPIRPKPPRQGETFYTRFVPSVGQFLSFRVASLNIKPQVYRGPIGTASMHGSISQTQSETAVPTMSQLNLEACDTDLLHKWMNDERVSRFWGTQGPIETQEEFLRTNLRSRHSFPVIGCWDGKPFGYFEIYWVKEDSLGKYLPYEIGNFDRGIHCLVGEQEFRGPHRVKIWLSALVHYLWLADMRTEVVMMEPRIDNEKYATTSKFLFRIFAN